MVHGRSLGGGSSKPLGGGGASSYALGLARDGAIALVARLGVRVCLSHSVPRCHQVHAGTGESARSPGATRAREPQPEPTVTVRSATPILSLEVLSLFTYAHYLPMLTLKEPAILQFT